MSPLADLVFMYGSPAFAFLLIRLLLVIPVAQHEVTIGGSEPETILGFVMGSITFAHLLPVFLRSHLNPAIRRSHRWKLLIGPPAIVAILTVSPRMLILGGIIAAFWDVYHTGQQNFGLGRIYDSKAGVANDATRRADRVISHVLYIGPILAGASLMDHVTELDSFDQVGWKTLAKAPEYTSGHLVAVRIFAVAAMIVGVGWYLAAQRRLVHEGHPPSPHKVALMTISAVIQIVAWGFSSPLVAFTVVNLYHAVQYFALVWKSEGRRASTFLGVRRPSWSIPIGLVLVFVVPAMFGMAVSGVTTSSALINASFLSVSLLHFWMDGFIWSVRKGTV